MEKNVQMSKFNSSINRSIYLIKWFDWHVQHPVNGFSVNIVWILVREQNNRYVLPCMMGIGGHDHSTKNDLCLNTFRRQILRQCFKGKFSVLYRFSCMPNKNNWGCLGFDLTQLKSTNVILVFNRFFEGQQIILNNFFVDSDEKLHTMCDVHKNQFKF